MKWETLDTLALLSQRTEATTSAGAGAFAVPIGAPLRSVMPGAQDAYEIPDEYEGIYSSHYSYYYDDEDE